MEKVARFAEKIKLFLVIRLFVDNGFVDVRLKGTVIVKTKI